MTTKTFTETEGFGENQDSSKTLTKTVACAKSCNGSYAQTGFPARSLGEALVKDFLDRSEGKPNAIFNPWA